MCEQLGQEPDPDEMPPELKDFPLEIQEAFLVHAMLPDRWDGASGSYMGKDWSPLSQLLDIQQVEDKKTVTGEGVNNAKLFKVFPDEKIKEENVTEVLGLV